jgi:anhydro-N-acetylmuramic acid kinase
MDKYMKEKLNTSYDNKGNVASFGKINFNTVKEYCSNFYFTNLFPKSLDKSNVFNKTLWNNVKQLNQYDAMSTLCYITAETINLSIKLLPKRPKNIIICGGGQKNLTLIKMLQNRIDGNVYTIKEMGLDGDFIESELIGFLSARNFYNLPSTFLSTTGTKIPAVIGDLLKFK